MSIIQLEVIDHDDSYGFFGKVVVRESVSHLNLSQAIQKQVELEREFPAPTFSVRVVELLPAIPSPRAF